MGDETADQPADEVQEQPAAEAEVEPPAAVEVEEPSGTDLVIRDPTDRATVMAVVDRHDEAMIVQELQRRSLKVMLYEFPDGSGGQITDLSYLGVNEAVRVMNDSAKWRVTIDKDSLEVISVEEDLGQGPEPCWQATVYAVNQITGYGQFGTFVQAKRMLLKDARKVDKAKKRGDYVDDTNRVADKFARQKAVNKAQRNALRIHVPETMRQTLIAQYQGDPERVRRIEVGAGAEALADLPAPLTDEKSEQQRETARDIFDQIRALNPLILLPAVFHTYLVRAESSHEGLESFIAYLTDVLEKNQPKERAESAQKED